ncbi:MAG: phosphoglycerate kinase [Nitrospira bacterium SG8_3]|nr:MAG: phosphoglycerate kinase [Nitrospira bacterium SG8_3]
MEKEDLDPRLRRSQQAQMKGKAVLIRVDHNVVKKGRIKDPYRIDVSLKTLRAVMENGGYPILMTHIGRPRDKKTGQIECREGESVQPIVSYLENELRNKIVVPDFPIDPQWGITQLDDAMKSQIEDLKNGKMGMIYLPNIRWFQGEQGSGDERERFAGWLAGSGDLYVNDAFSAWRAHVSTYDITRHLPSYAGFQLQEELLNIHKVLDPKRPFVGVIGGAKYDTKIGPIQALLKRTDHVLLGGLIYNVYLAAKYGVDISGVAEEERIQARDLVHLDSEQQKIVELNGLVESETLEGKFEGRYRTVHVEGMKKGDSFNYLLDIDPQSLQMDRIVGIIRSAKTIFVNAVMGLTPPFFQGTQALYELIASNRDAMKLFAGGDTLQELRDLCPEIYEVGMEASDFYYFTGGGSVLTTLEQGNPYELKPIKALME